MTEENMQQLIAVRGKKKGYHHYHRSLLIITVVKNRALGGKDSRTSDALKALSLDHLYDLPLS